MTDHR